jgi:putative ABC transport system substrate-binding protein
MDRRAFISTVTLGLVGASFATSAQQPARLPTIGFLGASAPAAMRDWVAAFVGGLHELGWIEGRTIKIEYRWAEGRTESYAEISNEFVRLKVDVIVTYGTAAIAAAKRATNIIPIVFAGAGDPVGAGLVASLARPGGNVTGLSIQQTDAAPKRLDLLREFVPRLGRLAIVANVDSRSAELDMIEIRDIASALGLHAATIEIRGGERIMPAIEALRGKADALYVVTDPLLFANRARINALERCGSRQCAAIGNMSQPDASCPTVLAWEAISGAPQPTSTKSSREPSQLTFLSSNPPSSSWSST